MTTSSNKGSAILLMAGVFLCGIVVGVAADRLWLKLDTGAKAAKTKKKKKWRRVRGKRRVKRLVRLFKKRLKLSQEQEKVAKEALEQSFEEMKPIRKRIEPELMAVRERARAKIKKVLSPKQLAVYEKMVKRYEARRAKQYK